MISLVEELPKIPINTFSAIDKKHPIGLAPLLFYNKGIQVAVMEVANA
jgi:hypothetical protein